MCIENYISLKKNAVLAFKNLVNMEGVDVIKDVLNDECFRKILEEGDRVWKSEIVEMYSGYYFPFICLFEEEEWDYINKNFGDMYEKIKKKNVLRTKFKNIITSDYNTNTCTAFELEVICKFYHDKILLDIDHKINNSINNSNVDALIKIDKRDLLVEATSFRISKPMLNRVGVAPIAKSVKQVKDKLFNKNIGQLNFTNRPTILVTTLIPNQIQDQLQAKWAVEEYFNTEVSKSISAVIVSDTYLFKYGVCHFNDKSKLPLNDIEKEYFLKCLKLEFWGRTL